VGKLEKRKGNEHMVRQLKIDISFKKSKNFPGRKRAAEQFLKPFLFLMPQNLFIFLRVTFLENNAGGGAFQGEAAPCLHEKIQ
jgi:hypothetical protein